MQGQTNANSSHRSDFSLGFKLSMGTMLQPDMAYYSVFGHIFGYISSSAPG